MSTALFDLSRGDSPLLISVPHAGTWVPEALAASFTTEAASHPDTDWHVHQLYAFARQEGVSMIVARAGRYLIDLNRDPQGAALYPGADNTELCPTSTFANVPVYRDGAVVASTEIERRRAAYFDPYHAAIASALGAIAERHGYALLLDAHSICAQVPRFFAGRLPDLNLGSVGGKSAAPNVEAAAWRELSHAPGFSAVLNGRFQGGYITRHFGQPARSWHALQLEIAQACYLDESAPRTWDAKRAAPLVAVLQRLVIALLATRPE